MSSIKRNVFAILFAIVGVVFVFKITVFTLIKIHSFLAVTSPVDAEVLVVEGWLFDYMLDEAVKEIQTGKYKYIVTTGKINNSSQRSSQRGLMNTAEICKEKLIKRGVKASSIHAVAAPAVESQHTLYTAAAIKNWLVERKINAVNVFTGGPHGRKSLIVFQKSLGKDIKVGIISCKIKHYPPVYWWTSLTGTKVTLRYLGGYLYALCLNYQ
jgi:uncharacterized SAM-binding protein YcdF (DUF218 family)